MEPLSLQALIGQRVVLDTQGPLVYIGRLDQADERGYWLAEADVHDRADGHATKEMYLNDAVALERSGARRVNRRRVFVDARAVVGVSALADVVTDDDPGDEQPWLPQ